MLARLWTEVMFGCNRLEFVAITRPLGDLQREEVKSTNRPKDYGKGMQKEGSGVDDTGSVVGREREEQRRRKGIQGGES